MKCINGYWQLLGANLKNSVPDPFRSVMLAKACGHGDEVYSFRDRLEITNEPTKAQNRNMKNIFIHASNRVAALALGGALVLAGSALAFTEKPKAEFHKVALNLPVDERPISRDLGSHNSFAP